MRVATFLTVALLVLTAVVLQVGFKFDHAQSDAKYPSLTFETEFMTPQTNVTALLGPEHTSPDRREIGTFQHVDFILIALYVTAFVLIAIQLRAASRPFTVAVCVSILLTGLFDIFEDRAILTAIGWNGPAVPANVAQFGFAKWAMLYASTLLLGIALLRPSEGRRWLAGAAGVVLGAIGVMGLGALVLDQYLVVGRLLPWWGLAVCFGAFATGR
jgi:hypothetical protein